MILDIKVHPDPILRQACTPVTHFDAGLLRTIGDMFETMDTYHGVGLAAPQIGLLQQILILSYDDRRMVLIKPQCMTKKGKLFAEEGCLSLPGLRLSVPRYDRILIKAQTPQGKTIQFHEKGFISRIIQHEMDHLAGRLIVDYQEKETT